MPSPASPRNRLCYWTARRRVAPPPSACCPAGGVPCEQELAQEGLRAEDRCAGRAEPGRATHGRLCPCLSSSIGRGPLLCLRREGSPPFIWCQDAAASEGCLKHLWSLEPPGPSCPNRWKRVPTRSPPGQSEPPRPSPALLACGTAPEKAPRRPGLDCGKATPRPHVSLFAILRRNLPLT